MIRPQTRIVTTHDLLKSAYQVHLVCGFYGPTHPKCKKAVDDDTSLYMDFLKHFKISDDDSDDE